MVSESDYSGMVVLVTAVHAQVDSTDVQNSYGQCWKPTSKEEAAMTIY